MRTSNLCFAMLCVWATVISVWPASAQSAEPAAVDYGQPASWLCRPGNETTCTTGLDAMIVTADGSRRPEPFVPAADPKIDCFYVYPTVSRQTTPYSDMTPDPEVQRVGRSQAGRLTATCRLFAPLYRQLTSAGLRQKMSAGRDPDWQNPYRDVLAAWRWYLAHDNHGRGVVLIGHSQGTILLQQLIAEEIDGKPAQALLVSAFLSGDLVLPVPKGAVVGGVFKHVPLCAAASQTGCAYVWSSYLADDAAPARLFGHSPGSGIVAGCVTPAAPAGGRGALLAYLPRPAFADANDPPWIKLEGQLSAACTADAQGNVLRVSIEPGRYADLLGMSLHRYMVIEGWGLHLIDVALMQGNIADVIAAESRNWKGR